MRPQQPYQPGVRRIALLAPVRHLARVERLVILRRRRLYRVVVRLKRLHNRPALIPAAPCPAGHLIQQLKRPLPRAIVRYAQPHIRRNHAHQRHLRKMQPFRNHLRPHQHPRLARPKPPQQAFVRLRAARDVPIPAQNPRVRIPPRDLVGYRLSANPIVAHPVAQAARTHPLRPPPCAAIVAYEPLLFRVIGNIHIAAAASQAIPASKALQVRRRAAPVQEQHSLVARRQTLVQRRRQLAAEHIAIPLAQLRPHIHHAHRRQLPPPPIRRVAVPAAAVIHKPLRQQMQAMPPPQPAVIRPHIRRGAAQNNHCARQLRQSQRHIPRVIAWRCVMLLVCPFVLFVYHD